MEERRVSERTYRRESYEQFGWMLARLHKYAVTGYPPSAEDWKDSLDHYAYWSGVVAIIGGSDVVAAEKALGKVIDDLGETLAEAALSGNWRDAYGPHANKVETARDALDRAMGSDLNRLASFEATAERSGNILRHLTLRLQLIFIRRSPHTDQHLRDHSDPGDPDPCGPSPLLRMTSSSGQAC
jgi:hypothetical protein